MRHVHHKVKQNTYLIKDENNKIIAKLSGSAQPTLRLLWFRFKRENEDTSQKAFVEWLLNERGFKICVS